MRRQQPTPRQEQILQQIQQFLALHGRPPTRADLAQALGLRNRQGIDQHLRALAGKGLISLEPGVARGIRLPQSTPSSAAVHTTPAAIRAADLRLLPLYGRVAAGMPTLANSNVEDELSVDVAMFRPQADFLLRVHGESMRDAGIQDRDILAVHRTAEARNGQIVVARIGDEATVKYFRRHGDQLRLEPANAAFHPILVDLQTQSCVIEGVVVGLIRNDWSHAQR